MAKHEQDTSKHYLVHVFKDKTEQAIRLVELIREFAGDDLNVNPWFVNLLPVKLKQLKRLVAKLLQIMNILMNVYKNAINNL